MAIIGSNATIVVLHDIVAYAFIGAGAVVTKTVPAYALLVGNPAKQIGWMSEYGHRLHFDEKRITERQENKQHYHLQNRLVQKIEE